MTEQEAKIKDLELRVKKLEDKVFDTWLDQYPRLPKANFDRNDMFDGVSHLIKSVNTTKWEETTRQTKKGGWVPNQEFTENGIKHNIEDAIQLAQRINNKEIK